MLVGGRYETIRELGRGGVGKTYLAEDTYRRGRPKCVVKRIQPLSKLPSVLEKARALFAAEAQMLYQLGSHDQIPKIYEHLEQGSDFFLIQELIDGHDLRQALTLGDRWDEKNVVVLLREILDILVVVHQHQVVHQDIKPQNLIRRWRDKKLVLIDFSGIKAIRSLMVNAQGDAIITQPIGTSGYMPEEQAEGNPQLCSDVYALGMMAIQALTGYSPKQLPRHPVTQAIEWHDQAQVSSKLTHILDKMVCTDPEQRYPSAEAVLDELPLPPISKLPLPTQSDRVEIPKPPTYGIVIEPKFELARDFSEDLAAVVLDDKLGYIDPSGAFAVLPKLEFDLVSSFRQSAYQFSDGLAQFAIAHKWGYISKTGSIVIPPEFDSAEAFVGGTARVEVNHYYGYINKAGHFLILPQFESAAPTFQEDLAGVEIEHRYGYIDRTGQVVIDPQFDSADSFRNGLARVTLNDKYGFINKTGHLVIPPEFDVAHTFSEGLARVRIDGKYGYIDQTGKIIIPPQFDDTFSFSEGMALIRNDDKYGYIDRTGKLIIDLQFDDAYPFAEGLAAVRIAQQWGYIDQQGQFIIDVQFDDAGSFRSHRAAVKVGDQWGYLGRQ